MSDVPAVPAKSKRIASIDWMRGFVMILMMIDHVSMAFNGSRFSSDSAALYKGGMEIPAAEFITRFITHLCAPTFVFLAGTALAIMVQSRKRKGMDEKTIDRTIFTRGLFIALLDPTLVSLFSWRLTFQVLYAIGVSMMCMTLLRRLSTKLLLALALGWIFFGELLVGLLWHPEAGNPSIPTALSMTFYYQPLFRISYPLFPWLAIMILGWVFGRYIVARNYAEKPMIAPAALLTISGSVSMVIFGAVRWFNGYGNMFLLREDNSWIQFLLVSKYPPSLSYTALMIGMLCLLMAGMIKLEEKIGVRPNGPMLVFGQTAMFFYLLHRVVLEGLATYGGLRGFGGLTATYAISAVFLVILYPLCRWYRAYKAEHPGGWRRFI